MSFLSGFRVTSEYKLITGVANKRFEYQLNRDVFESLLKALQNIESIPATRQPFEPISAEDRYVMEKCYMNWYMEGNSVETKKEQKAYRHVYIGGTFNFSLYLSKWLSEKVILIDINSCNGSRRIAVTGHTFLGGRLSVEEIAIAMIKELEKVLGVDPY